MKFLIAAGVLFMLVLVSGVSNATVFLPKICMDKDRVVACSHDSRPPATGKTARQNLMKRLESDLGGRVVIDLRNGEFQVITPPQWRSFGGDDVGYCVTDVVAYTDGWGQPPESKWFYYLHTDKEGCESEAGKLNQAERYYPFWSYRDQRIVCDSSDTGRCVAAAWMYSELKKQIKGDLANAQNVEISGAARGSARHEHIAHTLELLMLQIDPYFRVDEFRDLSDSNSCAHEVSIGIICKSTDDRMIIFPAVRPSY